MALSKIGALWKTKKPGSKIVLNGTITINGEEVRVGIIKNDKTESEKAPPYNIVTFDGDTQQPEAPQTPPEPPPKDDDLPF